MKVLGFYPRARGNRWNILTRSDMLRLVLFPSFFGSLDSQN